MDLNRYGIIAIVWCNKTPAKELVVGVNDRSNLKKTNKSSHKKVNIAITHLILHKKDEKASKYFALLIDV